MNLSETERLILANQYQLLSMQDSNYISQETAENYSTILLEGYELLYEDIFLEMDDTLSSERCRFALDVLSMYRVIDNSYHKLENPTSLTEQDIAFKGFDGNNEKEYSFVKFFIKDMDRFNDLTDNEYMEFNSHSISIPRYKRQLAKYNEIIEDNKKNDSINYLILDEEEIKSILRI